MRHYSENLPLIEDKRERFDVKSSQCPCRKNRTRQGATPAMSSYTAPRSKCPLQNGNILQAAWAIAVLYLLVKIANKR